MVASKEQVIVIKPLNTETIQVPIVGLSELIVNRFSEKAKMQMAELQKGKKQIKLKREARDPEQEFLNAQYVLEDGRHCFRADGFKWAIVNSVRFIDNLTMTLARQLFFVVGIESPKYGMQLVPIESTKPRMRTDTVRLQGKTTDLRYRPGYFPWRAVLEIKFNADMITAEGIYNLVNYSGQVGIGEHRPEKGGQFGMFELDLDRLNGKH